MSNVNNPKHYNNIDIECIEAIKHFNFCIGSAMKYLWRAGLKDRDKHIEDLEKAIWYIEKEIEEIKLESGSKKQKKAWSHILKEHEEIEDFSEPFPSI